MSECWYLLLRKSQNLNLNLRILTLNSEIPRKQSKQFGEKSKFLTVQSELVSFISFSNRDTTISSPPFCPSGPQVVHVHGHAGIPPTGGALRPRQHRCRRRDCRGRAPSAGHGAELQPYRRGELEETETHKSNEEELMTGTVINEADLTHSDKQWNQRFLWISVF